MKSTYVIILSALSKLSHCCYLYLTKKAADLLNIPIRAESVPGKGSAFILDLRK